MLHCANALLTATTMQTNSWIFTKSEFFLVGKVLLRSETNFFPAISHSESPSPVVHHHDWYPFYVHVIITQKVHNTFVLLGYRGMFTFLMLACIYFSDYGQRQRPYTRSRTVKDFESLYKELASQCVFGPGEGSLSPIKVQPHCL